MAKNPHNFLELRALLSQESDTPEIKEQRLRELFAAELLVASGMDIKKAIDLSRRETGENLMGENPQDWMDAFTRTLERLNAFLGRLEEKLTVRPRTDFYATSSHSGFFGREDTTSNV